MRSSWRFTVAAVLVLALSGGVASCGPGDIPEEPPRVLAVSPAQGTPLEAVAVEISGRHFRPRVVTDFASGEGTLDAAFRARLVPVGGGGAAVELLNVRYLSSERLGARVPAGLARGAYDVVVVDPSGAEARSGGAYRAIAPAESVAAFRFALSPLQRVGIPFAVSLTAVDTEGQTVDGFTGTVSLSDGTGSLTPKQVGPFILGRARALVTLGAPLGGNRLRAEDALGHVSESEPFEVRRGPAAHVAWAEGALTAVAGTCVGPVTLEALDALGTSADVEAPVDVTVSADPAEGFTAFSDAACTTAVQGGALSVSGERLPFFFTARRAGTLVLHARSPTLPGDSRTHTVLPASAAMLRFSSAARTTRVGACSEAVTLDVRDRFGNVMGPAQEAEVELSAPAASGITFHTDAACAEPAGPLVVSGATPTVTVHVRASVAGRWVLGATARAPSQLGSAAQEVLVEP